MKKSLLFSLLSFIALGSIAQSGVWYPQSTAFSTTSSGVRYISVVDTNTAWICAYDGSGSGLPRHDYSRTVNGGANWISGNVGITPNPNNWDFSMIHGLTDSVAWGAFFSAVTSHQGQIWKTMDAGNSWTRQGATLFQNSLSFLNNIYFWDAANGVATGDPIQMASGLTFEIYTTSDSGNTWTMADTNHLAAVATDEANQITHFTVKGDTIWWDSNHARVFRSYDRGHTWNVSNTNLINFTGIIDVCFYNHTGGGIARYYNDTLTSNLCIETTDGGQTWSSPFSPIGDMFGGDIKAVPGVNSMLVSTGISTNSNYWGTSYSTDGGHNWVTVETDDQRGVLGIVDSLHMWCGGFTTSPSSNGIYKWVIIQPVLCTDPGINSGTTTVDSTSLCLNDTAHFHTTGVYSPITGDFSGFSIALSHSDISGSLDPVNDPSFVGSFPFIFPPPSDFDNVFVNNGTLVNGSTQPYGTYYFTPVVFANATDATGTGTPVYLFDLILDVNCTYTGTSIAVDILDPNQLPCFNVGVNEIDASVLSVRSILKDKSTLNVIINSAKSGKGVIQILDVTGRVVKSLDCTLSEGLNNELVNVGSLAQGTYLVKAEMNGVKASNKIVKY